MMYKTYLFVLFEFTIPNPILCVFVYINIRNILTQHLKPGFECKITFYMFECCGIQKGYFVLNKMKKKINITFFRQTN